MSYCSQKNYVREWCGDLYTIVPYMLNINNSYVATVKCPLVNAFMLYYSVVRSLWWFSINLYLSYFQPEKNDRHLQTFSNTFSYNIFFTPSNYMNEWFHCYFLSVFNQMLPAIQIRDAISGRYWLIPPYCRIAYIICVSEPGEHWLRKWLGAIT